MQLPPWRVIVDWPKPDYVDPETRGDALLILMVVFSFLVFMAVIGRYYSRIVIKRWFGWDDSMITLAWVRLDRYPDLFADDTDQVIDIHNWHERSSNTSEKCSTAVLDTWLTLCIGKSQIWMGSPPLGHRVRDDPKSQHHRLRREIALRWRVHVHSAVARVLLLQAGGR